MTAGSAGRKMMTLKQFMLRSEVIKLYRSYMRLGRLIESDKMDLRDEWTTFVRTEFRMRTSVEDPESVEQLLKYGKRQVKELQRTILLAKNTSS